MEVTRRLSRALVLLLGFALVAAATPAKADGPKADLAEARTRYKKGLDLYQEGAFDAALIELQRAYDLAPSYKILYNIALVDLQLNDYAGALRAYRRYLDEGAKKLDAKRKAEVDKEIEKLEARVATIKLETNVEGAEVLVDDLKVGETPLPQPLVVNAGKRKLTLNKAGYSTISRVIVVAGRDEKTVELELRTVAQERARVEEKKRSEAKQKPARDEAKPPSRQVPWMWWGITGGLAAGTAVAGVLTLGAQSDLDDKKKHPATKDDLDSAAGKTRTLAIVTDVFLVGTVAVGGYATYLTFFAADDKDPRAEKSSLGVRVGPTSASLVGTF